MRLYKIFSQNPIKVGRKGIGLYFSNFPFDLDFCIGAIVAILKQSGKESKENQIIILTNKGWAEMCAQASRIFIETLSESGNFPLWSPNFRLKLSRTVQSFKKIDFSLFGLLAVNVPWDNESTNFCISTPTEKLFT